MLTRLRLPRTLVAFAALALAAPARTQVQNPFQPSLRWTNSASNAQPWLPLAVDFAADGNLVWAGNAFGTPELELFSSHDSNAAVPFAFDAALSGAQGAVLTVGSSRADRLFSAAQFDHPDALHRQTLVARHDVLAAAHGANFTPSWTHDMGWFVNGPMKLAADEQGSIVVAAVHDATTGLARIDWLDGQSGALLARKDFAVAALRVISLSNDGAKLAVVAATSLYVFDSSGATLHQENLGAATNAMALSGDGRRIVVCAMSTLRVLDVQLNGTYAQVFAASASPSETATRCAISDDGSSFAIGWWNVLTGVSIRFELWDGATFARTVQIAQNGAAGGPQNFPEVVAVTPDGRRAALGAWGVLDAQPEVVLVDKAAKAVVFSVDLPGSVQSLALDRSGTRLAVGMKHAHANQFSSTGEFRLYDTGERDLQLVAPPTLGATLNCASLEPGSSTTLFLLGTKLAVPETSPHWSGSLWIDRHLRLRVFARASDSAGRANLSLPLPLNPAWIGSPFAVQAAARVAGKLVLSADVIVPVIL